MDPEQTAVAVKSTTGMWTAGFTGATAFALLALLIRQVLPWRKQTIAAAEQMREELSGRVGILEKRLDTQGKRHDAHIEILRQLHEGETALLRHRLNGEEQINIALMAVLKTLDVPARAMEALEASRARKQEAIATEQAELTKLRATAVERIAGLIEDSAT